MKELREGIIYVYGLIIILGLPISFMSCRTSKPPVISIICIGDGTGGADCVTNAGDKVHKTPSQLKGFWMTTEVDQANFSSWCYDAPTSTTTKAMNVMKSQILP